MKKIAALAFVLIIFVPSLCLGESWDEFVTLKQQAEKPKLIPKGALRPDMISKDVIIQRINQGQPVEFSSKFILFEYGRAAVRPEYMPQVDVIAESLRDPRLAQVPSFYVDGHTCAIGTNRNNCRLSWERAARVVQLLVDMGVPRSKLIPRGFGENCPAYSNESEPERAKNRRVVLVGRVGAGTGSLSEDQICREWAPRGGYATYGYRPSGVDSGDATSALPGSGSTGAGSGKIPTGGKDIPKGFSTK